MRTSLVSEALALAIQAGMPLLLEGAPGVGKSDLVTQAAQRAGADLVLSHPAVSDPMDYKGLPWPDKGNRRAKFLPFGELADVLEATTPTVWFLDDLGQATPAVQAACMQLLLARRVNEHVLPDCVTIVAATNGRAHRAGVQGLLEPVKSRFVSILSVEPCFEDWKAWAYASDVSPEVISFLNFRPALFHAFEPTADLKNSPSPRTWVNASRWLKASVTPPLELEVFSGAVGAAAATEFVGYLRIYRDLPNPDVILLDPGKAKLPTTNDAYYGICTALAHRATKVTYAAITRYAMRMADAGFGEFVALLVGDCQRRCPDVVNTQAHQDLLLSDVGRLFQAAA